MTSVTRIVMLVGIATCAVGADRAFAEPIFLARQYARCSTCHYSPTGGGLLTPYGRSLSHHELSTTGKRLSPADAQLPESATGEEAFLYGVLGDRLGPVQLGIELRPAHLNFSFAGTNSTRDFFMNADLLGAYRVKGWTLYGEIGRQPVDPGSKIDSYEYWAAHQSESGFGFRIGRFLPAYGVHFADHTAFNRFYLGFEKYDQIYGVELSRTTDRYLLQVSLGPGFAESIIHDDGRRAFTSTGRFQFDFSPRQVIAFSGLYRNASEIDGRNGSGGVAYGFAPVSRVTIWTQADARFRQGATDDTSLVFVNETAVEAVPGLWLKVSPQILTEVGEAPALFRVLLGADWLPRTHWNVNLAYYRDLNRATDLVSHIFLVQLHLYL